MVTVVGQEDMATATTTPHTVLLALWLGGGLTLVLVVLVLVQAVRGSLWWTYNTRGKEGGEELGSWSSPGSPHNFPGGGTWLPPDAKYTGREGGREGRRGNRL